jgi:hypothetical protein
MTVHWQGGATPEVGVESGDASVADEDTELPFCHARVSART